MYTSVENIPHDLLKELYEKNERELSAALDGEGIEEGHLRDVISNFVFRDVHPDAVLSWFRLIMERHNKVWEDLEPIYTRLLAGEILYYELEKESIRQVRKAISEFVTSRAQQLLPLLANGQLVKTDMYDLTFRLLGLSKTIPNSEELYDLIDKVVEPS